ncbi:MAG: hypothetical protein RL260_3816 [Pseudomonadota bacterium]
MTPTTLTIAARTALTPPRTHQFGLVPSVPAETITALREAHEVILVRLHNPATAPQALREWVEAINTASAVTQLIGYGVDEMVPHIDDALQLAQEWAAHGTITLTPAISLRLAYCAAIIDSVMRTAPHEVVVACAEACEAMCVGGER